MSPRHYFQLFNREARLFLAIGLGLGALPAVVFGVAPAQHSLAGIIPLIMLPVFVGAALGRTVLALETRPASLVVPGLRHQLWRCNTFLALVLALVWGCAFKMGHPDLPLVVLVAGSAALITAPVVIYPKRMRWITILPLWTTLYLSTFFKWDIDPNTVEAFLTNHQLVIGLLCFAITGWQLWLAGNATRIRGLGLALREETSGTMQAESDAWFAKIGRWGTQSDLGARRSSLRSWVQAIHRESPGFSNTQGLAAVGLALVLLCPLLKGSGGYPLAWYLLVFPRGDGDGWMFAILLWTSLIGAGLASPVPRRDVLYPIPRRMRAQVAFWSSVGSWLILLGVWSGVPLLFATLAGWWLNLPMSAMAFVHITAPAMISLVILPILRIAALHWEGRSNMAMWATVIVTIPLTIAGWIAILRMPPGTSVLLAVMAATVGLTGYYVLLRDYFIKEDLIQPRAAKQG